MKAVKIIQKLLFLMQQEIKLNYLLKGQKVLIKYYLTNRELFSEINNLILGYAFSKKYSCDFLIDDSKSSLYFSLGYTNYFDKNTLNKEQSSYNLIVNICLIGKNYYVVGD